MRHSIAAEIAWRYLRSKQTHSAVRAITAVAIWGVAVATAAIICVLSVFNGFRDIISEKLDTLVPDVIVTPARGKVFHDADSLVRRISLCEGVAVATPTLTDNALALFQGREMPVTLKGVSFPAYRKVTGIDSIIVSGTRAQALSGKSRDMGILSIGVVARLGIPFQDERLTLFAPRRIGKVNMANPSASFLVDSVRIGAIYQAEQSDYDADVVLCDIALARDIFQYDGEEASAVEVRGKPGVDAVSLASVLQERLKSDKVVVKDRARQQEMNFRMISIEKWVTYLLLFFILAIASFNIISTLCMAVIEKQRSMATLRALGMTRRGIGDVFWWESLYVTLLGGAGGIIIGVLVCLLQQHYGLVHLQGDPSSLVVSVYPVRVEMTDVLLTIPPLLVIGFATAWIASAFSRQRLAA